MNDGRPTPVILRLAHEIKASLTEGRTPEEIFDRIVRQYPDATKGEVEHALLLVQVQEIAEDEDRRSRIHLVPTPATKD
jgi:hypothetical protein